MSEDIYNNPLEDQEDINDAFPEKVDEVIIIVNYLADQIRNYFGEEWKGRKIKYVFSLER